MTNFFNKNFSIKVLSFLMAVLLWGYVSLEKAPQDQVTLEVPLEARGLRENQALLNMPRSVKVRILGNRNLINKLTAKDIDAYVDLSRVRIGENNIRVQVKIPSRTQLVNTRPQEVKVNIDRVVQKQVPVRVRIKGETAEGYRYLEPSVTPEKVLVNGPQKLMRSIKEAETVISLENEKKNVSASLPLTVLTRQGAHVDMRTVTVEPQGVKVIVPVIRDMPGKIVPIHVRILGKPSTGYDVKTIAVVPDRIEIFGPAEKIDDISYISTEIIKIMGAKNNISKEVTLELPADVETGIDRVLVVINIRPLTR